MYRVGIGQDSHHFSKSKKALVLGGIEISKIGGLLGKSDADVILHSLCNALSSSIGGDSLATWSDEMCENGIPDSKEYVKHIFNKIKKKKYKVQNVAIAVEAKKPYLEIEIIKRMKEEIARILEINLDCVGITFTSGEGLTAFGQGKGIQSVSQVLISQK